MKIKMQTIINICLAVSITLFIYQNDKQQDKINQLQMRANFDENILIKLNQIELKINEIDKINNLQQETLEIWQKLLNEKLSQVFNNQENLKITENNVLILFQDRDKHRKAINENIEVTKLNRMYIDNLREYIENK
jgi:hypothetical protein